MSAKKRAMSRSLVVSNTTPLITLVGVGLLDLLPKVYTDIWVPRVVVTEFQFKALPTDLNLQQLPWLTIINDVPIAADLPRLGAGEAAAISLAESIGACFVLLDERRRDALLSAVDWWQSGHWPCSSEQKRWGSYRL